MSSAGPAVLSYQFIVDYREALDQHLRTEGGEEGLMLAYDLGRRAVNEHNNILDLVAMHQKVVLEKVLAAGSEEQMELYLGLGENFLAEVMAPFEMMHRGFDDTIRQLQQINATLELRVEERTQALRESQRKTATLARLYQILSSINSAIVRLHDRTELFREACRIAVDQGGYQSAWINLKTGGEVQVSETWCHHTDEGALCDNKPKEPLATVAAKDMERLYHEARPIVHHGEPDKNPANTVSYALLPLTPNDQLVGVFGLFSHDHEAFTDEEMRLLLELAGDISYALHHIQREKQLKYLAYYDTLTGLPNRSLLMEHLPMQFKEAIRVDNMVALLLVDLMNFSRLNDTYGRHVGDSLLKETGERLRRASANRETVARVGADSFSVSFTGVEEMNQVAHRLEQEVLHSFVEPFVIEGHEIHIAVQVGIALFPSDGTDADTLYKNGEIALKLAQSKGEPYLLYNPAMNERIIRSVTMEGKLRKALEDGELLLNYQPKVSVIDGRLEGMEALVRYADPEEGVVLPGRFIPLMEESGMIVEIGNWVMRRAARDLGRWQRLQLDPPRIAFNVSPIQLRHKDFITSLKAIVPQGEPDHGLDIEITESAVMEDVNETLPKLHAVRELGFGIAIDDFGTGYSSLSYLSRLPVNTLKIDRSFIVDMTERPNSMALVTTIITLAHSLNMKVVAEGVDKEDQAKLLRLLRCDLIQGNLYSLPLTVDQVTELLLRIRSQPAPFKQI